MSRVARVEPPPSNGVHDASSSVAFQAPLPDGQRSAEEWARAIWEQPIAPLRWMLIAGWRAGLGLRLGPLGSPDHVLGWPIAQNRPDELVVRADSKILEASNEFAVDDSVLTWSTHVRYRNPAGRVVWAVILPAHVVLARLFLRRATKANSVDSDS